MGHFSRANRAKANGRVVPALAAAASVALLLGGCSGGVSLTPEQAANCLREANTGHLDGCTEVGTSALIKTTCEAQSQTGHFLCHQSLTGLATPENAYYLIFEGNTVHITNPPGAKVKETTVSGTLP